MKAILDTQCLQLLVALRPVHALRADEELVSARPVERSRR